MGLFNNFPYMDLSNLNLDFILKKLKDLTNYAESAESDANRAETAKTIAVTAQNAAEAAARSAESSSRDAQAAEMSAESYAAHIADPVGGLVTGWLDDNITPTTPPVDASLTIQGAAADAKATGDAVSELRNEIQSGGGFGPEVKTLLESLFRKVAIWSDDDADATIDQLHDAMFPPANLSYITAVYTQSGPVYTTDSLDSLKQDLVVTAYYSDSTSRIVTAYTLIGILTEGTSTITVGYGGKTATFTVTVTSIQSVSFEVGGIGTTGLDEANSARTRSEYIPIDGSFTYNVANGSVDSATIDNDTISAQIGGIDNTTGAVVEQPNRIVTQFIRTGVQKLISVSNDHGYYIKAFAFNSSMARSSSGDIGGLDTDSISATTHQSARYVKLLFKKPDNSDFTTEELSSLKITLNHFKASSNMTVNASQSGYSFRVYDVSHNFLALTGDQAINFIDSSAYIANWLNADETDYYVFGLPAGSKFIRAVARDVASSDVSTVSGNIEIDNEIYAITLED